MPSKYLVINECVLRDPGVPSRRCLKDEVIEPSEGEAKRLVKANCLAEASKENLAVRTKEKKAEEAAKAEIEKARKDAEKKRTANKKRNS